MTRLHLINRRTFDPSTSHRKETYDDHDRGTQTNKVPKSFLRSDGFPACTLFTCKSCVLDVFVTKTEVACCVTVSSEFERVSNFAEVAKQIHQRLSIKFCPNYGIWYRLFEDMVVRHTTAPCF